MPNDPRCLTLMYHEICPQITRATNIYKIADAEFRAHVAAIAGAIGSAPVGRVDGALSGRPVFLTFDDGEASAYTTVAGLLEDYGWRGHFFVITDFIGRPGYLTRGQIHSLAGRGHVIGSHTCSHPIPITHCTPQQLRREWRESVAALEEITGAAVKVASVPGGYYSKTVAEAAVEAGISFLFNSEPTDRCERLGGCLVLGRYAIKRGMGPEVAAALAAGQRFPRWKQSAAWQLKKALKGANVSAYLRVRSAILRA